MIGALLNQASGPVHTGSGTQVVFHTTSDGTLSVRRDRRVIAEAYLRWLTQRFVSPGGFGAAQSLLEEHGVALLSGAAGTGRRSAAMMLLRPPRSAVRGITELNDTPDSPGEPILDPETVESGDRLFLDLTRTGPHPLSVIRGRLAAYYTEIRARGAQLVVVLPPDHDFTPAELRPFTARLGRPDSTEVLQRYLRLDGQIRLRRADVRYPPLDKRLSGASMGQTAELAILIGSARQTQQGDSFAQWCDHALLATRPWTRDVSNRIARHRRGWQRALLISAAMLNGALGESVLKATQILYDVLDQPPEEPGTPLERADLSQLLAAVDAETDAYGRVRFTQLAYDRAVRFHFWTNRPDLRDAFRVWVDRVAREVTLNSDERAALMDRFAEQCLRTGRPEDLEALARSWTGPGAGRELMAVAADALERGLRSEEYAGRFRNTLYLWCTDRTITDKLRTVIAGVCTGVIAHTHPHQALVRLHQLARREDHAGATPVALEALRQQVVDPRKLRFMLGRLANPPEGSRPWELDARFFLELADPFRLTTPPAPLILRPGLPDVLTAGWRVVLEREPCERWREALGRWLHACAEGRSPELLLTVLVNAARHHPYHLQEMYAAARHWAHAAPERLPITHLLLDTIDLAQEEEPVG
ncbi:hypothetical protein ACFV5N_02810 [Streptomyces sp. NPDC059853]|uniref:hypothetical protein n=1 Tax=Streptomyces sp. NPDC059853 TaxID=3346973 RepID=UPI003654F63B